MAIAISSALFKKTYETWQKRNNLQCFFGFYFEKMQKKYSPTMAISDSN